MSMILTALPQLEQQVETLKRELYTRNRQLNEAEEALRQERAKTQVIERGVQELRSVLSPLHQALKCIFGEIDAMGLNGNASPAVKNSAAWEQWKQRLGEQQRERLKLSWCMGR